MAQMDKAAPKETPKELRKTVRTREGLIQSPNASFKSASFPEDLSDKSSSIRESVHEWKSHAVEASAPQTKTASPSGEALLPDGTEQYVPDVKTRSAYVRREASRKPEQPERTVERGRQRFVQQRKCEADMKRAAERRLKITEAQLPGEDVEETSEKAGNLAVERTRQTFIAIQKISKNSPNNNLNDNPPYETISDNPVE